MTADHRTGEIADPDVINYEVHPAADIFPLIQGADFTALVEDIRTNGQMEPVVLDVDGRLIDGRNRARACQALGVDVKEATYDGDDVAQFVVSHNLHRRHLTDTQRAMIAARLANLPRGGDRGNQHTGGKTSSEGLARSEARELLGVSEGSMHRAKVVERNGTPSLVTLASEGKVPLASAARVAEAEPDDQERFVADVRAGAEPTKASLRITEPQAKPAARQSSGAVTRDMRAEMIRKLADQGLSSRQMPGKVGVTEETIRQIARDFGIEIPADRVILKTRRHDSHRIAAETVATLDGLAMGIELINYDDLDPQEARQWADSLNHSLRALNRFHKQIKETTHG